MSIPNDVLSVAFMAKGYAHGRVSSSIDQQDIDYLRSIQNSDAVAAGVALDAALNGTDQITKTLTLRRLAGRQLSPIMVLPLPVSSIWVASGFPWRHAKTAENRICNYTTSIYDYDSNKWNDSRYRKDDTGFNVDAGIAADFGEHWTVGVSGQNLMSRDIDTKDIRIRNGRTGKW